MTLPPKAALREADGYWRQFVVTASFLEPTEITGTLIDLGYHKARDETIPKLRIQTDDGIVVVVIAGQTRLQSELVRLRPAVGDRIKIVYTGEAPKAAPGMNPTKEFTVAVRRPGSQSPARPESTRGSVTENVPGTGTPPLPLEA